MKLVEKDRLCEDYGMIGNMKTAALVHKRDASIDFMCFPSFDAPSIFCRLLDEQCGGSFVYRAFGVGDALKQFYHPSTNVLITRFCGPEGIGQIVDTMPVAPEATNVPALVRRAEVIRGRMSFEAVVSPSFDYSRTKHAVYEKETGKYEFQSPSLRMHISALPSEQSVKWTSKISKDGQSVTLMTDLEENQSFLLVLDGEEPSQGGFKECNSLVQDTIRYWQSWIRNCTYRGRWREDVLRSALALKMMVFAETGAIIASPTFSLPEHIGGDLNWDYRYAWIRDADFTTYAFIRIGLIEEARGFMEWIERILRNAYEKGERSIRIMYSIHLPGKEHECMNDERTLDHLHGYHGSHPIRIGNAAVHQTQTDIYGELMDSIYLCDKYFRPVSYDFWLIIREMILEPVRCIWQLPDNGIWEIRGQPKHYLYSKVMCWVALDRGIRLALKHSLPGPLEAWRQDRDAIMEDLMKRGWNSSIESFVQHYESDKLDAANLIMPLVFFISAADPRFLSTMKRTLLPPEQGGLTVNHLVYRNQQGAKAPSEGTFGMCSFWLVEAMARAGKTDPEMLCKATEIFEDLLGYGNHVGLFSEGIDLAGRATGNFPQAFTHFSLISAAFCLDRHLQ